ncbi:MAG: hypothetical protein MZU97_26755 [Bacillus subtilis]|nr:hypothetical protein [Bacillus subtilis]
MKNYPENSIKIEKNNYPYPEKELDYKANVINTYAEAFYRRHQAEIISKGAEAGIDLRDKKVMTTKHCLKFHFNLCPKQKIKHSFKEPFYLIDSQNKEYLHQF